MRGAAALLFGLLVCGSAVAAGLTREMLALYDQAAAAQDKGDCPTAIALYQRVMSLLPPERPDGNDPNRINVGLYIALCQHALGRQVEAFDALSALTPKLEPIKEFPPAQLARVYDQLSEAAQDLGRWRAEAAALHRGVEVSRRDPGFDALDRFDMQARESIALRRDGREEEGRKLQQAMLAAHVATPALARRLPETLNALGKNLENAGYAEEATTVFDRLIGLLGSKPDRLLGVAYYDKAIALRALQRRDDSFDAFSKSYEVFSRLQGPNGPDAIDALGAIGQAYDLAGRPVLGRTQLGEAFARAERALGPDDRKTLLIENNLANVERKLGDLPSAQAHDRDAYERRRKALGPADSDTIYSAFNLALDEQDQGHLAEADALLSDLEATLQKALGGDGVETLRARYRLADLALARGDLDLAAQRLAAFDDPAMLARLDPNLRSLTLGEMAALADRRQDSDRARALFQKSYEAEVAAEGPGSFGALTVEANWLSAESERSDADILARVAKLNRAAVAWSASEVGATRSKALRERTLTTFDAVRALIVQEALRRPSPASRLALFEAMEAWKGLGLRQERLLADMADGADPATAKLARAALNGADPAGAEAARAALAKADPGYAEAVRRGAATAGDAIAALKPGEALLDYWVTPLATSGARGDDHIVAVAVDRSGVRAARDLGEVGGLTALLSVEALAKSQASAVAMYQLLVGPFAAEIGAAQTVYVAPDGDLYLAPFDALAAAPDRYWIADKRVVLVRGAASLAPPLGTPRAEGVVIFDDIDYGRGQGDFEIPRLGPTEGPGVAALLRAKGEAVTLVTGKAATKAALLALSRPPRILHLSTHAAYRRPKDSDDDPLKLARVVFAGVNEDPARGTLWGWEAARLKLSGSELVVLSACQTAAGTATYAEGLAGLPSALAIAGARRTLLALWPVSSEGTQAFMLRFYQHLSETPDDYAGALRATKLDVIAGRLPEALDVWRAFTLLVN